MPLSLPNPKRSLPTTRRSRELVERLEPYVDSSPHT
jgi:hypothetical protein